MCIQRFEEHALAKLPGGSFRSLLMAMEIDWALWLTGQELPATTEPYHRTPTIFY